MISEILPLDKITKITLNRSEYSIPSDLRHFKKLGFILLVLKLNSIKSKASILKLQFFNWAFKSPENLAFFNRIIVEEKVVPDHSIHLDPSVNKVIDFGIADNFLSLDNNGKIYLSDKGELLANKILEESNAFLKESEILISLKKSVSEARLEEIFKDINKIV